ncbi:unnamed protein product [Hyaloperonospora brassicae]|uniref:Uncharacterized protein n=1 Tax=Hyaloperonospora brassicae TaxID=162125 RepID=A0AAV0TX01_HYABA|nr:unnamed protein product [Hyaloperonospora brassicae]
MAAAASRAGDTRRPSDASPDAAPQPSHTARPLAPHAPRDTPSASALRASEAPYRARVRTVRITTRVHPDMLVPYLYTDRPDRCSINAIGSDTACTIDYCALSPSELAQVPPSQGFGMNFLVAGHSRATLEAAAGRLQALVETVEAYLLQKTSGRSRAGGRAAQSEFRSSRVDAEGAAHEHEDGERKRMETDGRTVRDRHWAEWTADECAYSADAAWASATYQVRGHGDGWRPWKRRQGEMIEDKEEWSVRRRRRGVQACGRRSSDVDAAAGEGAFVPHRGGQMRPPSETRRRVRRTLDAVQWVPRQHSRGMRSGDAGYAAYAVASSVAENEPSHRMLHHQQNHYLYQGSPKQFAQAEFSPYGDDRLESDDGADVPEYEETADSANATVRYNDGAAFFTDQHRSMYRSHPCRSLKRPLSKVQRNGTVTPPSVYRKRIPYMYDYRYDDEEDEWMTEEEEEVGGDYGIAPQFRSLDSPVVHQRPHFDSRSPGQWGSPVVRAPHQLHKRRRIPPDRYFADERMNNDYRYNRHSHERTFSPVLNDRMGQLHKVAANVGGSTFPDRLDNLEKMAAEEESTASSSIAAHTNDDVLTSTTCATEPAYDMLADSSVDNEPLSSTGELPLEQRDPCENAEALQVTSDNTAADEPHSVCTSQMETVPLESAERTEDAAAVALPQNTIALASRSGPVSNETDRSAPGSDVSVSNETGPSTPCDDVSVSNKTGLSAPDCDVSDSNETGPSAPDCDISVSNETDLSAPCGDVLAAQRENSQANISDLSNPLGNGAIMQAPVFVESTVDQQCTLNEGRPTQPTSERPATDAICMNDYAIESLKRLSRAEADFAIAERSLLTQEAKLRQAENRSNRYWRLKALCDTVCYLQCQVSSCSRGTDASHNQDLLDKLESFLESAVTQKEQTLHDKVVALQGEVDRILAVRTRVDKDQVIEDQAKAVKRDGALGNPTSSTPSTEKQCVNGDDAQGTAWEDSDWPDEDVPCDVSSETEACAAQTVSEKSGPKIGGSLVPVKLERGMSPSWPRELPPFVRSMLSRVIFADPQSYVMRAAHERLLDEIAKGDPYYYLQPKVVHKNDEACLPLHSSVSPVCEFGCRGSSALKWKQKLVSQISARMKSFDDVAYSLARSSGGNGVLNRKKVNSIIRKLHFVAVQLHSLVSHLYCVKSLAVCKEVDSLPTALNNSHFERKMGVYKSRLKLALPHTYRQHSRQQQHDRKGSNAMDELLLDTYEFLPELLLCVDIWGYNYRESVAKRHDCKNVREEELVGSETVSMGAMFPLGYFREVENLALDFKHDGNGLLRSVCDELLNIVCLWNDFKWTDDFDSVTLDRVMSFESDVTSSIVKIFDVYGHHLQALWSLSLLDQPEQLLTVNFTQPNAYYSDRSRGSLTASAGLQSRAAGLSTNSSQDIHGDLTIVDQVVATEIMEQRLAEDYWNQKVTALSLHSPGNGVMEVDIDSTSFELLDADTIRSWDHDTRVSHSLRPSDAYAVRSEMKALSAVTSYMMRSEVHDIGLSNGDGSGATSDDGVDQALVDASSRQLLAAVSRAQMVTRDALIGSEKLALHSASTQLADEGQRADLCASETDRVGHKESSVPVRDVPSRQALTDRNKRAVNSERAGLESEVHDGHTALEDSGRHDGDDANADTTLAAEQPELQDLVRLLALTKQSMQDLCSRRPRSARMREKVQTQSLQLAYQAVEIFRNMTNMYASQRR